MVAVELARGIGADNRTTSYRRRRVWAVKHKNNGKFPVFEKVKKAVEKEVIGRFYPGDDVKKPLNKRVIRKPTRLRGSISPGTVLILLAGRFKGKRVVFLKQLPSGLLLVSGPFKVNGVPARRVNQAYVIATSTKINLPADLDTTKFDDAFFKSVEKVSAKKDEMFTEESKPKELTAQYLQAQKTLDTKLVKTLTPELKGYLGTRFSLNQGDRPHLMKF